MVEYPLLGNWCSLGWGLSQAQALAGVRPFNQLVSTECLPQAKCLHRAQLDGRDH